VEGCIYDKYWRSNGPNGSLGFPTSDVLAITGGYVSYFAGSLCGSAGPNNSGSAIYSSSAGTFLVKGCIYNRYWQSDLNGPSSCLGFPTSDEFEAGMNGDRQSNFQHGYILWHASTGAVSVACSG
jgi:uncharacterized protein with LGFP repeats